jgi:leucyl aminopeptidase
MPLDQEYFHQMKSQVADMKNIGGSAAGSCTAAVFLKQFVDDKYEWAHIDIAGVMEIAAPKGYYSDKGMTGKLGLFGLYKEDLHACS